MDILEVCVSVRNRLMKKQKSNNENPFANSEKKVIDLEKISSIIKKIDENISKNASNSHSRTYVWVENDKKRYP